MVDKFQDLEELDQQIASALKKLLTADFKRRVFLEEQKAEQNIRFLMKTNRFLDFYDYFQISGPGEAPLEFNDPPRVQLKSDNVQGFDTKWDEVLLSMTKGPVKKYWTNCTKTAPPLRGIDTSHGTVLAGYGADKENRPVMLDWHTGFAGMWSRKEVRTMSMPATKTGLFKEQQHAKDVSEEILKAMARDTSKDRIIGDCF